MSSHLGLTVTVSVSYDWHDPNYWTLQAFFNWTARPLNQGGEDSFAVAWGSNALALISDDAWGRWTNGTYNTTFYRSDVTANVGVGYSFNETSCSSVFCPYADFGYVTAYIHETTFHNLATNVVAKYFHTYANSTYSLSFGTGGPSITITPTTNQWSLAEYTEFTS